MKCNKSPGEDNITAEMLKASGESGANWLCEIINEIWEKEDPPIEWQRGTIVIIPKKGDLTNCDNYRGITLLSVPGKVLSKILLNRMTEEIDGNLRENQAGFRKERSYRDQIFILRRIIEKAIIKIIT